MRYTLSVIAVALVRLAEGQQTPSAVKPAATPVRPVTDTYHGSQIVDNYRWLEDGTKPEVQAWFRSQNGYARSVLDGIPGREKLRARIAELGRAGLGLNSLQSFGGRFFYLKRNPADDNFKLFVRESDNAERLLLDPEKLTAGGVHYSISYFMASPDGKLVAVGIAPGGSEAAVLRVIDTATGRDVDRTIDRAQFGAVNWLPNSRSYFYNRLQKLEPGQSGSERYLDSRVYLHKIGDEPDADAAVLGKGVSGNVSITREDIPFVILPAGSRYAFGYVQHGVQNEATVYIADMADMTGAATPWRKIVDTSDDVTSTDVHGDSVYLLSHHGASRYKVLRMDARKGDVARASTVIPATEAVVTVIAAASDALYVQKLDGGLGRLWRAPFNSGAATEVRLPFDCAIRELFANPEQPGVYVRLASWTRPPAYYHYNPENGELVDTKILPRSPLDFSGIESEEVKAPASDGTLIPLSIIHQRGLKLDGSHPTLLHGYGSYGMTYDPGFDPTSLAWLERGGVIAVAHVRGGGEYGEDWHNAGRKATKKNTIGDFIACAEYLIQHKYTSPAHLAGEGTSAGGITIGGAITARPELFAAALDNVGLSDAVRTELEVSGPANIAEFGTVKEEAGFRNLLAVSPYHRVKDKTPYPAVLLTTGANDPRVDPWQMAKMTARLQAATSSGKPILLRVDYDGGHGGIGATRSQSDALLTDQYSFLLWQLGHSEYQMPNSSHTRAN